jgi:LysR family transcriptional regulator, transcription activator of glutamate synthase operon
MDINYFKEFVVLAQTGNFLEAADILYSSQSTLSKHIKSMELELGVPLFDRTTRKVKLSKFGQLLLPFARQITEIQDKYNAMLKSNLETDREVMNLGSIYGLAQYKITEVLVSFKKSRPQSTLNVLQASSRDLKEMLRQSKCELAFIREIEDPEDEFVKIPYATDTIVAVLPRTHALASQKTIDLLMLADENFLLEVPNTMPYRLSIKACELSGFEPKVTVTDIDREYLIDLVSKGMGVSLMLKQILLHFSDPEIAIVDITPNVTTQIHLCYLKGIEVSEAAKHFLLCAKSTPN